MLLIIWNFWLNLKSNIFEVMKGSLWQSGQRQLTKNQDLRLPDSTLSHTRAFSTPDWKISTIGNPSQGNNNKQWLFSAWCIDCVGIGVWGWGCVTKRVMFLLTVGQDRISVWIRLDHLTQIKRTVSQIRSLDFKMASQLLKSRSNLVWMHAYLRRDITLQRSEGIPRK